VRLWTTLSRATTGWGAVLRGQPGWREHFTISPAGLATAFCIFLFGAFLAVALASANYGMPSVLGVLAAMFVLSLPVAAIVLSLLGTRKMLKSAVPSLDLLVPAVYAATIFLFLEGILAMVGGPLAMLSWLALGYALFRLARAAYGWNGGIAGAFATLTVLLLVALRTALYMLTSLATAPI